MFEKTKKTIIAVAALGVSAILAPASAALDFGDIAGANVLLGIQPTAMPQISLEKVGTYNYTASGSFTADLEPDVVLNTALLPPVSNMNTFGSPADRYVRININIDPTGTVATGVAGDDLVVYGSLDTNADFIDDAQGVLLTGEIVSFGYADTASVDTFDFRFRATGGALMPMFAGHDISLRMDAETSSFAGDFTQAANGSFVKGLLGPTNSICMNLSKQISVDAGATWLDADNLGDPDVPTLLVGPGSDVNYRVIAQNCGGVDLQNAVFNDAVLGVANHVVGNLAVGASVTIDGGTLAAMDVAGRCVNSGSITNSAIVNAESITTTETISASDTAVVECVALPSIKLLKQISVDAGASWHDADTVLTAPNVAAPHGAEYRFIVENNGTVDLTNVSLNDAGLGVLGFIFSLPAGTTQILGSGSFPPLLGAVVPTRCTTPGSYPNVATVSGSATDGTIVSDSDTANLVCTGTPGISILKEISIDGSLWADAKNVGDLDVPETLFPSDAQYRFTITNTGNVALENVVVTDAALGITGHLIQNLAVAEVVVLTQGDIAAMFVANRCTNSGTFTNSVSVTANESGTTGSPVSDSDTSVLECVGEPGVKIVKEITTNGIDWFDANDASSAPSEIFPSDAEYRFVVSNIGTAPLINVVVNDTELGITNYVVGNLAVNESITITSGDLPAMNVSDRCTHSGTFTNIAQVDGESAENGVKTTDDDPAVLVCTGEPNIELVKEVSVDGGLTWADANTSGGADVPTVVFPHDAEYRLTVRNTGTVELQNVIINDADLGIIDVLIPGILAVDGEVIVGAGDIPALAVASRCAHAGEIINVARVSGDAVDTGNTVNGSDPAILECVGTPHITVLKQISLDGTNWADADAAADADVPHALAPSGAEYRFIVRNDGTSPLTNVTVNDAELGIVDYLAGDLAVGAEVIITSADITAMTVATRCGGAGTFINVVDVTGDSTETGETVGDSDPAVLICNEPPPSLCDIDVDLTATDGNTPPPVECAECDGKITTLTLRYNGTAPAFIVVEQKRDSAVPVFSATVEPGSTFSFVGMDAKGTLSTEISITVDGVLNTAIHTSCSVDVLPGMTFGSFTVVEGASRNGGSLCPVDGGTTSGCTDVTYTYTVTNNGDPVDVLLEDDTYDLGLAIFPMATGESQQFTNDVCVPAETTNTASVTATVIGNPDNSCGDAASVTTGGCVEQEVWVQHCTNSSSGGQQCSLVKEIQVVCDDTPPPPPACEEEEVWVQHCTNSSSGGQQCSLVKETKNTCDDTPPPPPEGCAECDGKVTNLTLRYNGVSAADVVVTQKKDGQVVFSGNVAAGGEFSFTGQDDKGTLTTEITVAVNGVVDTRIHTSCSVELYPGLNFGSFTVMGGASRNGGDFCPLPTDPEPPTEPPTEPPVDESCAECDGKVTNLTLRYNGASAADVVVTQKKDGQVVFNGSVAAGSDFSFSGKARKGTLTTEITVAVNGVVDTRIHTSCSVEIYPGLNFGSFTVMGGASRNGGEFCPVDTIPDPDPTPVLPPSPIAAEGCTPGYWKQKQHFGNWTAPYDPSGSDKTMFADVFEDAFPGMSLRGVLRQGGGDLNALGRHTAAALLNAATSQVNYGMSPQDVIDAFNAVYPGGEYEPLKNVLNAMNESGCPLARADD